jgi:hypothetical protein
MTAATLMRRNMSLVRLRRFWGLAASSDRVSFAELAILIGGGAISTIASYSIGGLGIPGSNMLQAVLPMAAGLAIVPRRGAGILMGLSSLGTGFAVMGLGIAHFSPSELSRLVLLGFCLEVGPARAESKSHVWLWFVFAGLAANMLGFGVKYLVAQFGIEGFGGGRGIFRPLPMKMLSWAVCGALAGGVSALIFFRRSQRDSNMPDRH